MAACLSSRSLLMSNAKCLMLCLAASSLLLDACTLPSSKYSKRDSQLGSSGEIVRFSSNQLPLALPQCLGSVF